MTQKNTTDVGETKKAMRYHVSFPNTLHQRLVEIQTETHATTTTRVLQDAFKVYERLVSAHENGNEVDHPEQGRRKRNDTALISLIHLDNVTFICRISQERGRFVLKDFITSPVLSSIPPCNYDIGWGSNKPL